jgi:hypothetical protein
LRSRIEQAPQGNDQQKSKIARASRLQRRSWRTVSNVALAFVLQSLGFEAREFLPCVGQALVVPGEQDDEAAGVLSRKLSRTQYVHSVGTPALIKPSGGMASLGVSPCAGRAALLFRTRAPTILE